MRATLANLATRRMAPTICARAGRAACVPLHPSAKAGAHQPRHRLVRWGHGSTLKPCGRAAAHDVCPAHHCGVRRGAWHHACAGRAPHAICSGGAATTAERCAARGGVVQGAAHTTVPVAGDTHGMPVALRHVRAAGVCVRARGCVPEGEGLGVPPEWRRTELCRPLQTWRGTCVCVCERERERERECARHRHTRAPDPPPSHTHTHARCAGIGDAARICGRPHIAEVRG